MKLYVDLETLQLIEAPGFRSPITSLRFKRGDAATLEVVFLLNGTTPAALTGTPAEMVFCVKKNLSAESPVLMLAHDWTLDEETLIWSSALASDTVAMTNLLGNLAHIDLLGELSWTLTGGANTTQTVTVRVFNDIWKGTEDTPLVLPTPAEWLEARLETLGLLNLLEGPAPVPSFLTDGFSLRGVAGLTLAQWAKGAKLITTRVTAPAIQCRTTTGYAKLLRWDGTFASVSGNGSPVNTITLASGSAPASPYNGCLPKFLGVFPCLGNGIISGDLEHLLAPAQQLTAIDLRGLGLLNALDVATNDLVSLFLGDQTDLVYLDCSGNRLTSLAIGAWPNMSTLKCAGNLLTALNTGDLGNLVNLDCSGNAIAGVLSLNSVALNTVQCSDNQYTAIDFGDSVTLQSLVCYNNALTALDLTGLVGVNNVNFDSNSLDSAAVDAAFLSLDAASVAGAGMWTCYTNAAPTAASADRRDAMANGGWAIGCDPA